jgi:hypothetical protein
MAVRITFVTDTETPGTTAPVVSVIVPETVAFCCPHVTDALKMPSNTTRPATFIPARRDRSCGRADKFAQTVRADWTGLLQENVDCALCPTLSGNKNRFDIVIILLAIFGVPNPDAHSDSIRQKRPLEQVFLEENLLQLAVFFE